MQKANQTMAPNRFESDRQELADRISKGIREDGKLEVQPGLFFYRAGKTNEPVYAVAEPSLCIIARGSKEVLLGDRCFQYDPAHYLIATMELPVSGRVVEATPQKPYLSLRLLLEPSAVTSVLAESGYVSSQPESNPAGIDVSVLHEKLLDAVLRLVRLLDDPLEYQVLAAQTIREIIFRLAMGDQRSRLTHIANLGGQSHRMVRAIRLIRQRFDQPIRVDDLAGELKMSVSSLHSHFKAATSMSPLQFQKLLRLQEARRLMLDEDNDAAQAAFRVGYEDAAQFNREYKRQFGLPPKRDADRLKQQSLASSR
jgi:AraC-like DNA-binding protein